MPQKSTPEYEKRAWQAIVLKIEAGAELAAVNAGKAAPKRAEIAQRLFEALPPPDWTDKGDSYDPMRNFERVWRLYLEGQRVPAPTRQREIMQAARRAGYIQTWLGVKRVKEDEQNAAKWKAFETEAEARAKEFSAALGRLTRQITGDDGKWPAVMHCTPETQARIKAGLQNLLNVINPGPSFLDDLIEVQCCGPTIRI